jgi:hypothetical protein
MIGFSAGKQASTEPAKRRMGRGLRDPGLAVNAGEGAEAE